MKATLIYATGAIALTFAIGALVPSITMPGALNAQEAGATEQNAQYDDYLDAPQTPGTWFYEDEPGEKLAWFGSEPRQPIFMIRCAAGTLALARVTDDTQTTPRVMSVTTESMTQRLEAEPVASRAQILAATIETGDPLLDAMAITKGRFAIEVEGLETLYMPAWVEVSRVIEDCR